MAEITLAAGNLFEVDTVEGPRPQAHSFRADDAKAAFRRIVGWTWDGTRRTGAVERGLSTVSADRPGRGAARKSSKAGMLLEGRHVWKSAGARCRPSSNRQHAGLRATRRTWDKGERRPITLARPMTQAFELADDAAQ